MTSHHQSFPGHAYRAKPRQTVGSGLAAYVDAGLVGWPEVDPSPHAGVDVLIRERIRCAAIEELDVDGLPPLQRGSHQTVHPIDHPHTAPIYKDRRQRPPNLRQSRDVRPILPSQPRRLSWPQ
jgi:hypothetical protein